MSEKHLNKILTSAFMVALSLVAFLALIFNAVSVKTFLLIYVGLSGIGYFLHLCGLLREGAKE